MAQTSKNKQRLRRMKRQISLHQRVLGQQGQIDRLSQALRSSTDGVQYAKVTLLALLAQAGGEAEFTQGTLQQVLDNVAEMHWVTEPKGADDPNTMVVRLVMGKPGQQEAVGTAVAPAADPTLVEARDTQLADQAANDDVDGSGVEDAGAAALTPVGGPDGLL